MRVIVISDLHLGGQPSSDNNPGFQICGEEGQLLLADFLQWAATLNSAGEPFHLIVNGDSVDFLAERPFQGFTADNEAATTKLKRILCRGPAVWANFRKVVASGAEVTFTLGNHDLELTLPGPRRLLRDTLGAGRVDLIFDNSALRIGDMLIEHGNRYDGWNAVNHDALRRVRSAVSRGEKAEEFPVPPGTRLVIDVMNDVKQTYRFVDLLKPEQEAALPIIAALKPSLLGKINKVRKLRAQAAGVHYGEDAQPDDPELIAAHSNAISQQLVRAAGADAEEINYGGAALGIFQRWVADTEEGKKQATIEIIYELMETWFGPNFTAFDTQWEVEDYMRAVRAAAGRGTKLVSYGHTHLAKRIILPAGTLYLNTGTWADLMAVPRDILLNVKEQAKTELRGFVDDLAHNRIARWKRTLPTYADIQIIDGAIVKADVLVYEGNGKGTPLPNGRLTPLGVAAAGGD
jgi:UDP-2,3-diacylglucosamine pyrophosphatase LpxH